MMPAPARVSERLRSLPLRILVVEDDPDTQVIVSFALKRGGHVIDVCGTGQEALVKAPVFAPDLVLLDVMLPFMDGPAILKEMRADPRLASAPVVFMTARAFPEEIAHYRSLGSLDVIVKPFDPMTLAETVSAIWARHHRDADGECARELQELEETYLSRLGDRLLEIERCLDDLSDSRASALDELFHLSHRLTGSSAILGFNAVSEAARGVETVALSSMRRGRRRAEEAPALAEALAHLRRAVRDVLPPSKTPRKRKIRAPRRT